MAPLDERPHVTGGEAVATITPAELRATIVADLRVLAQRQDAPPWSYGWQGIERMTADQIRVLPTVIDAGNGHHRKTIFAWIGERMSAAGHPGEVGSVGAVVDGLTGGQVTDPQMRDLAHEIGCYCNAVTADSAADAIDGFTATN